MAKSQDKEHATDFEKIIHAGRERKKNEALAARIFNRDKARRSSAPSAGSLASRAGVKKRLSSNAMNNEWTHDLHGARGRGAKAHQDPNSLAARIHAPGTKISRPQASRRAQLKRPDLILSAQQERTTAPATNQSTSWQPPSGPSGRGITIRGLAGPFVVMAQNFAPGTTAADIESAMTPVGGLVSSCRVVKTHPLIIAEIVFESKEGADRVIAAFNNQTADGRTLSVYLKPGGPQRAAPPTGPRAQRENETRQAGNVIVDGRLGFDDPMDTDDQSTSQSNGGLYSDTMIPKSNGYSNNNHNDSRRGRGFRSGR